MEDETAECPECGNEVDSSELDMFDGMCEECREENGDD